MALKQAQFIVVKRYLVVEKKNYFAVHGLFDDEESSSHFLDKIIPEYVAKGYYKNKNLKEDDFKIIERRICE